VRRRRFPSSALDESDQVLTKHGPAGQAVFVHGGRDELLAAVDAGVGW
jgi:hypothetical protein